MALMSKLEAEVSSGDAAAAASCSSSAQVRERDVGFEPPRICEWLWMVMMMEKIS